MPKVIVSIDGVVIKEAQLTQARTTIGRRPYNDIVIDNLAVSGEHAALELVGQQVLLHDLGSTNGTRLNGRPVKLAQLQHDDLVEIGKYRLRFLQEQPAGQAAPVSPPAPSVLPSAAPAVASDVAAAPAPGTGPRIRVLNGPGAGRELPLVKIVTTLGKPGVGVAAITHRPQGFALTHIEGEAPAVNGQALGSEPLMLADGDHIDLSGVQMQFVRA
ncbi:FHA domain-containing protein [Ramlibacter sp. 2FC]|uniref:FHA domain-containing protein n=1 Tax=Ramlibacter sp. 2FC TaxID=2502188 RepID=UPI0010F8A2D3|nr:FHA domain-containing protein [Ramlibacter sp. 2FC]